MSSVPALNPFPGLRPFESPEGYLFFGREGQSQELLIRLQRNRFLALVGTSGSGKSSLVRAGLLPFLYGGWLRSTGSHWRAATFRPGDNPIRALAQALNGSDAFGRADRSAEEQERDAALIEVRLRRSGLGLIEVVRLQRLAAEENVLIIIDQFEELFRYQRSGETAADAAAFVKLFLEAIRQTELPIFVVLTMRSDFIGDCSRFRDLPETVAAGLYLIPRMTRDQRRAAIEEPVRVAGGSISQRLINRLLNDAGDDPDQLPIMQHALMRTWDHWRATARDGRPMDLEDYLAVGGMAEALSRHAEEAFGSLDPAGQDIARKMFQCLTEKGADNREMRRAATVGRIAQVVGASIADVSRVIAEFRKPGRSFLMPPASVPLDENSLVDPSHESLIRKWRRLSEWVDEEADWAKSYGRLAETAMLHQAGRAGLWSDPDLSEYLAWSRRTNPTRAWAERYNPDFDVAMAFLEESRRVRDAAVRQRRQFRRGLAAAAVIAIAVLSLVTLEAVWAKYRERAATLEAQRKGREAAEASEDVAQVARLAREQLSDTYQTAKFSADDVLKFATPGWSGPIHHRRAGVLFSQGDFNGARRDIDLVMKDTPDKIWPLVSSSYLYLIAGNAQAAVDHARAVIAIKQTDCAGYGNLFIGLAILRDYAHAIQTIDEALQHCQLPIDAVENTLPPDVQQFTHSFKLQVLDTSFLLALRYAKAALYAMNGDERFKAALDDADHSDIDYPYSREAYLATLTWEWLILRGQMLRDLPPDSENAPASPGAFRDYGLYAAEGALWERVARTRAQALDWPARSYEKFRRVHGAKRDPRYQSLAKWVGEQSARQPTPVAPDSSLADEISEMALQADELKQKRSSPQDWVTLGTALEQLSRAIAKLDNKRTAIHLGRREQDLLVKLLLRRSEWLDDGGDKGGASKDARRVIAINPNISDAFRLLADAAFDDRERKELYDHALSLDPYNSDALQNLADLVEGNNPAQALELLRKRQRVVFTWSDDYRQMARLEAEVAKGLTNSQKTSAFQGALANAQRAIELAPWRLDLRADRREIEKASGLNKDRAELNYAKGLRAAADFNRHTGTDAEAIRAYVLAFVQVSALAATDEDTRVEQSTIIRNLSSFVASRYRPDEASEFWRTLAHDPLLSPHQRDLSAREADRLSHNR
jgi:energy-coupling factor transporter ATP-binding protein EcfA2